MWVRDGRGWRWNTLPELRVLPCRMEGGAVWWVCWMGRRAVPGLPACAACEDCKRMAEAFFARRVTNDNERAGEGAAAHDG